MSHPPLTPIYPPYEDRLVARVLELEPGQVITHQEIATLFECAYPSPIYRQRIQKATRKLISLHGVYVDNDRGVGYFRVAPKQQLSGGVHHVELATKRIRRAGRRIVSTPDDNLDQTERAERSWYGMLAGKIELLRTTTRKRLKAELKATPALPRPPRG